MKYYVTADVHGYYSELKDALEENGFFNDKEPHKLIICGDLFDRGKEAKKLEEFVLDLLSKDEIILIRGNHEDLAIELLQNWHLGSYYLSHHHKNGTIDTVMQLTNTNFEDDIINWDNVGRNFLHTPYIEKIIPAMLNYYETDNYIFTHGWLPSTAIYKDGYNREYILNKNWRNADNTLWSSARWIIGMEAAHSNAIVKNKTVVCGHWHCSYGHAKYEKDGGEFDNNPNFSPYYGKGVIALDACTIKSHKINCIVIEN